MAVIRKIGELVGYAFLGALITPLVSSFLSRFIIEQISTVYAVPMSTITAFILSFFISYSIKTFVASHMTLDLNHISISIILFILQFLMCSIFLLLGMNPFVVLGVITGSFFNIIATIIMRPFTAYRQVKEFGKEHLEQYWNNDSDEKK